jgi:hypothetical protein
MTNNNYNNYKYNYNYNDNYEKKWDIQNFNSTYSISLDPVLIVFLLRQVQTQDQQ